MIAERTPSSRTASRHESQGIRGVYDLLVIMVLAVLLPGLVMLPVPFLRVPLGLAAALFVPGYSLVAALFPMRHDLDGIARAALSLGLSAAILPVFVLAVNALPWGIRPLPMALAASAWSFLLSAVALWRHRRAAKQGTSYVASMPHPVMRWHSWNLRVRVRYMLGAFLAVLLLGGTTLSVLLPDRTARLTEFYVLGPDGLAGNYPRSAPTGQEMLVQVGINNREGTTTRYRVEVRSAGELLAETEPVELKNGATWEGPVSYRLMRAGDDQRIDILLFNQDSSGPYRQLWLWVSAPQSRYANSDVLRRANVNFDRQMQEWQRLRNNRNESAHDWEAFRKFEKDIGAPDPGLMPTELFATARS